MLNFLKNIFAKKTAEKPAGKPVGEVVHFYNDISVAIIKFNKEILVGTTLHFKGATTDFKDTVKSMQYDHKPVVTATKGMQVGIKVKKRVREGDFVHLTE
jgi:putative protease